MCKKCVFPGCINSVSDRVVDEQAMCNDHIIDFSAFKKFKFADSRIPEEIKLFIFLHPDGCNCRQAEVVLGYTTDIVAKYVKRGVIKAKPSTSNKRLRIISQKEIMKLAYLKYCWVSTGEVATLLEGSRALFNRYAKQAIFGKTAKNLSNDLCIKIEAKEDLDGTREKYNAAVKKAKIGPRSEKVANKEEFTCLRIAEMVGDLHHSTVKYWYRNGFISGKIRRNVIIFSREELFDFIEKVLNGEVVLWKATQTQIELLREKLTTEASP